MALNQRGIGEWDGEWGLGKSLRVENLIASVATVVAQEQGCEGSWSMAS